MKTALKAQLFNSHSFKTNLEPEHSFKTTLIPEYQFSILVHNLAKILGISSDFDMLFSFDVSGNSYLLIKQKADVNICDVDFSSKVLASLSEKNDINIGEFKTTINSILSLVKEAIDININQLNIDTKNVITHRLNNNLDAGDFCAEISLLNFCKTNSEVSIGEFNSYTNAKTKIKQIETLDIGNFEAGIGNGFILLKINKTLDTGNIKLSGLTHEKLQTTFVSDKIFDFNAILINAVQGKSSLYIGEFESIVGNNYIKMRQNNNIDIGNFDFGSDTMFLHAKTRAQIEIQNDLNYKLQEVSKSKASLDVGQFEIYALLINAVLSKADIRTGGFEFNSLVNTDIRLERNIYIPNVEMNASLGGSIKDRLLVDFDIDMKQNLKTTINCSVDLGAEFEATSKIKLLKYVTLGTLDPHSLSAYDNKTLEEIERSVIEE